MFNRTTYEELTQRGMIAQVTHPDTLPKFLDTPQTFYVGFDPTATSLHVGSMLPVMVMAHLQRRGHKPIVLVGGATGMIGDPSGKSEERQLLSTEKIEENLTGLRKQLSRFFSFEGDNGAIMVDNLDWTGKFSYIEWLRDVGKHFTVNYMMQKKSVQLRLENREQGISYTEFSYMLLQAHDFLHLFRTYGCKLQCGGDDQWGNITAGIDLIRKRTGEEAYGLTWPLMTTASGEKFGKSAGNAVWLDPVMTSPYHFYQYWIQTADEDVEKNLKYFTFLSLEEIAEIISKHSTAPEKREAQIMLANEITRTVHGEEGLRIAKLATEVFFGEKSIRDLNDSDILPVLFHVPVSLVQQDRLIGDGTSLVDICIEANMYSSKSEVRRAIAGGGLYVNDIKVTDDKRRLTKNDSIGNATIVLRKGKKDYYLISFGTYFTYPKHKSFESE